MSDELDRALRAALGLLGRRLRSRAELRRRLQSKGFSPGAIDQALQRLADWGYVDDVAFAKAWVNDRSRLRPAGRALIHLELRARGIAGETVTEALQSRTVESERELAVGILAKRLGALRDQGPEGDRRLLGYLLRRGFSAGIAREALKLAKANVACEDLKPVNRQ